METVSLKNAKRILSVQLTAFRGVYMPSYVYLGRVRSCYVIAALIPLCILGCDPKAEQNYKSLLEQIQSLQTNTENIKKYIEQASEKQVQIEEKKLRREKVLKELEYCSEILASSRAWKIEALAFRKHEEANRQRQRSIVNKQEARSVGTYEGYEPYNVGYLTTYSTILPLARRDLSRVEKEGANRLEEEIEKNLNVAKESLRDYPGYTNESLHKIFDDLSSKRGMLSYLSINLKHEY